MTEIRIVRDYPHPPAHGLARRNRAGARRPLDGHWTRGATRRVHPHRGSRFQLVAKPVPGWRGIVDCEVLEVDEPHLLRYTWRGEGKRQAHLRQLPD